MNSQWINKIYKDAQDSCGLNVGDWVKVTDILKDDAPWYCSDMNKTMDMVGQIKFISPHGILVHIKELRKEIYYPYFVLEKTNRPCPFKIGDYVQVKGQGPMKSDIVTEGRFPIWRSIMDCTIGKVGVVIKIPNNNDIYKEAVCVKILERLGTWNYAFDCLEKVDKPVYEFKPFEQVLVRETNINAWKVNFYGRKLDNGRHVCLWNAWAQCIPYKGNEHLLGTTDSPKD